MSQPPEPSCHTNAPPLLKAVFRGRQIPDWLCGPSRAIAYFTDSFLENRCLSMASSLSYATVLSIVPLLAVAFSITKGLGMYDGPMARDLLLQITAGRAEVADNILTYISNTNVKALGVIGGALLLFTAVSLIGTIESAFNAIWSVSKKRGMVSRFTNYLTLIFVCPVLIFTAISVTASAQSNAAVKWLLEISVVSQAYLAFLAALPYLVTWAAFFLIYKFLPNAKTGYKGALTGALAAGSMWQATQWVYIRYQVGAAKYNAIYGGFSQIPLLLAWLYVSWVIVLLGGQLAFAVEYYAEHVRELADAKFSHDDKVRMALLLMLVLTADMNERRRPRSLQALADLFSISEGLAGSLLAALAEKRLVTRTDADPPGYLPAAAPRSVSLAEIRAAVASAGENARPPAVPARFAFIDAVWNELEADPALAGETTIDALYDRLKDDLAAAGALAKDAA